MMNEGISVADALALRNTEGGGGNNNNGWGGDGWWIVLLILLFAGGGWNRNGGFGGGVGNMVTLGRRDRIFACSCNIGSCNQLSLRARTCNAGCYYGWKRQGREKRNTL